MRAREGQVRTFITKSGLKITVGKTRKLTLTHHHDGTFGHTMISTRRPTSMSVIDIQVLKNFIQEVEENGYQ